MRQTKWSEIVIMFCPIVILPIILFFVLHSTPVLALRTHLFFNGHPVLAVTTKITDDREHNRLDKEYLKKEKAKCYTLTKAPKEKITDSYLTNYIVYKRRIFI
ncbi:hypothetical protein [Gottfriedia luciferensis]|uniref:hypothetical protein n=1 Tax=Gottfriedia luciferensis TaxID=178774 RepID=UPI000B444BCF|nr:hypothetical protein [Gottfriedia luciferensis]